MTDIVKQLRGSCTDFDKLPLARAAEPMPGLHCDLLYDAASDIEQMCAALTKIRSVVGTSTEAWHIADAALRSQQRRESADG